MTSECPYCHRRARPGERVMFTTECRLQGIDTNGYSVAFDVQSETLVVHRACWDRMVTGRGADASAGPGQPGPLESDECASVERTDALSFME